MAVSRVTAEGVGDELRRLFGALEEELAAGVAKRLQAGIDRPDWADKKLAAAGEVRRWVEGLTRRVSGRGARDARKAVEDAFARGGQAAERALAGKRFRRPRQIAAVREALPGLGNINALAASLGGRLEATGPQVVRSVLDAYRQTVTAGAATVLGGATARRDAAQTVWNRLLDQGFSGFTDARGRRWSLAGYVDMATRTTTAQAAVQGQLDRQAELGLDLVIVSNAPQECPRCRPWEGKVLTRDASGTGGRTIEAEHAIEDKMISVRVAGSVAEAIAAGLLHPNCRHSLSAYLPGLTTAPQDTADPEGNAARVKLRALEREARAARLQQAGALTPEGKAAAAARLRATQAKIKHHVKDTEHLGIKRKPERERLDLGNVRSGGGPLERASGAAEPTPAISSSAPTSPAASGRTSAPSQLEAYGARQASLRAAVDRGIEREVQLGGGETARVDRLELRGGGSAVRKLTRESGRPAVEQQDAEELAALVADAIGTRAPAVVRRAGNLVDMEHVDGPMLVQLEIIQDTSALRAGDDARRIALLDELIGNTDRNAGNIIVRDQAKARLDAIDHGSAFDFHPEYNSPDRPNDFRRFADPFTEPDGYARRYRAGALRPGEAVRLRDAIEPLLPEFERVGRPDWHRDMLRRLAALERAGEGA